MLKFILPQSFNLVAKTHETFFSDRGYANKHRKDKLKVARHMSLRVRSYFSF